MIDVSIRRLVLDGVGVALFYKGDVRIMDAVTVHIKVVDRDLGRGIWNVLEGDYVVIECKLQLLRGLHRLIVLTEDVLIVRLGCQIGGIHLFRKLKCIRRRTRNCDCLGFCDIDIRMISQYIIDRVRDLIGNRIVVEDDRIRFFIEGQSDRLRCFVGNVTCYGRRVFGDLLSFSEGRIGDDLVVHDLGRRALLIIVHRIADRILLPVCIKRNILRYRLVPVIRRTGFFRCREPPLEGIVLLRRIGRNISIEAVFTRLRCNRRTALRIERDRTGRESEITIEHQAGRHDGVVIVGIQCISRMLRVGKPSQPGCSFYRRGRNVAGQITVDVVAKRNILCTNQRAVIVVEGQRVFFCIIVEVEAGICCIIMCCTIPPRSSSMRITAEIFSPSIVKCTVSAVLCFACCCIIPGFCIAFDLIPVIHITQVIILHVDRLHAAIGLALVSRRCITFCIVLEPVFQMLMVTCRIIMVIDIDRICRTVVRTNVERRHDRQALELAVILVVITPAAGIAVELIRPCLHDIRTVFSGYRCAVAGSLGYQRIHIAAITNRHDRGAIRFDRFRRGIQERKVRGIQFIRSGAVGAGSYSRHGDFCARCRLLCYRCEIGIIGIVCILYHVNDLVFDLRRRPLRIERGVRFERDRGACRLRASFIRIPTVENIAGTRCRFRQRDLSAVRCSNRIDIVAAADVVGQREVSASIIDLQFLFRIGCFGDRNILITFLKLRIRIAVDIRRDLGVLDADLVNRLNQRIAVAVEILQIMSDFIRSICSYVFILYFEGVLAIAALCELILRNRYCRFARIIGRLISDFRCNRITRRSHGVEEIILHQFIDL